MTTHLPLGHDVTFLNSSCSSGWWRGEAVAFYFLLARSFSLPAHINDFIWTYGDFLRFFFLLRLRAAWQPSVSDCWEAIECCTLARRRERVLIRRWNSIDLNRFDKLVNSKKDDGILVHSIFLSLSRLGVDQLDAPFCLRREVWHMAGKCRSRWTEFLNSHIIR